MLTDVHPEPGATAAARLGRHLEDVAPNRDRVIPRDHAGVLTTEDRVEVDRAQRYERTGRIARRARERRIVHRQEVLDEIAIGRLEGGDPRHAQLVDEAVLQRPIQAFAPPAGLRRVGRDVLDAEARHHRIVAAVLDVLPIDAVCSIDEFAATVEPRDIPAALTHQIKQRLRDAVGDHITCSIGYAPNRWLAKIAADLDKPDGLTVLRSPRPHSECASGSVP